jgi:hypothetical protein
MNMKKTTTVAILILFANIMGLRADDLVGKLDGKDWKGTFCKVQESNDGKLVLDIYAKPVKGMKEEFTTPHLIVKVPKKDGAYGQPQAGVTFFIPPGSNQIDADAKVTIATSDKGTNITVTAKMDENNWAKGTYTIGQAR